MPAVLGVDSSTQSTKVVVVDLDTGEERARGSAPHPLTSPPVSEQDPAAWWEALVTAIAGLDTDLGDVVAMSVAGQQHGLVLLDDAGSVIRPAKLWNDTTSAADAARLVADLGAVAWAQGCGSVPVASFTISKLAWIAEHEPETMARVRRVMLPHDFLTWRLTGGHVTDRGDASGTGWFDPAANRYRRDLLESVVDSSDRFVHCLPEVLGPREAAGEISGSAAEALGLPRSVVVAAGTGDNMAAALGLGLRTGDVAMSLGTSGTVYSVSDAATADPTGLVAGFADAAGGFLPLACTLNATRVTDTVAGWLGTDAVGLDELAGAAAAGFDGTILIPYFDGERTPNLPDATGSFHGLRTSTSRAALARAAHDGVLCGLFAGLDALRAAGVAANGRLHLIGGGARAVTYRQRAADLAGEMIVVPDNDEVVALGAAVQAAATYSQVPASSFAEPWGLGDGPMVAPRDSEGGRAVRDAYTTIAARSGSLTTPKR
jgi:xylulokinase